MEKHLAVDFHNIHVNDFNKKYTTNLDFKQRYITWTKLLDAFIVPKMQILDLGCGSGIFSFYIANRNCHVTGIDGAEAMIDFCRKTATSNSIMNVQFIQGFIPEDLSPKLGLFDVIICSSVLEYIEEKETTLSSLNAFLKKGGILVISVPNRLSIHRRIEKILFNLVGKPEYYQHVQNTFSEKEFTQELLRHGFKLKALEYYANQGKISKLIKYMLPTIYTSNLMVGVFEKLE